VELAGDRGDVGLEIADADDDQRQGQVEHVQEQRVALLDLHREGALGQGGGQGAGRRQALDVEAAGLVGAEVVGAGSDLELGVAGAGAAGDLEGVAVALVGQGLLGLGPLDGQGQLADGQQHRAEHDGAPGAEELVGQDAADQGHQVDQGGVGAVLGRRVLVLEQEVLGQVVDQQRPHPVVGKPLPHLGEEQHHQPAWVFAQLHDHGDGGQDVDDDPDQKHDVHEEGRFQLRRSDAVQKIGEHITRGGLGQARRLAPGPSRGFKGETSGHCGGLRQRTSKT
jgi:hypothetical protein